jgi:hypothetical protein
MNRQQLLRGAVLVLWLASAGCTTLREVPRSAFRSKAERKAVRVETTEGLVYEFDYATLEADTLTGYRNRPDIESTLEQVAEVRFPLDQVQRLTERGVDWRRTGIVGGSVVLGIVAVGLTQTLHHGNSDGGNSGGGKGITPSPPRRR